MTFSLYSKASVLSLGIGTFSLLLLTGCVPSTYDTCASRLACPLPSTLKHGGLPRAQYANMGTPIAPMPALLSHCTTPPLSSPVPHKARPHQPHSFLKRQHGTPHLARSYPPPHRAKQPTAVHKPTSQAAWHTLPTTHFNGIHAEGALFLQIKGGKHARLEVANHSAALQVSTQGQILHLKAPPTASSRHGLHTVPIVKITLPNLKMLSVSGAVRVQGTQLHTENLVLEDASRRAVVLDGFLNISRIRHSGQGRLEVKWADTQQVHLIASAGHTLLAGKVNALYINATRNATVDTRHTRAKTVWIHTQDNSRARILAKSFLHAQAQDLSQIAYYKAPLHRPLIHTQDHATVLQYDAWR